MILRILRLIVFVAFAASFTKAAETGPLQFWITTALVKVRPGDPPLQKSAQNAEIWAARNEFESFQLILRSARGDLSGVDATVSILRAANGSTIPGTPATIYREEYLNLQHPSSVEGESGYWPDPLIPQVDRYWHERRSAFPFLLKAQQNQALWIEIYVPIDQAAGDYQGSITIYSEGSVKGRIPLTVHVWDFVLPSTSSLQTAFGLGGIGILKQHRGAYTRDKDLLEVTRLYTEAALLHRISTYAGSMIPPRTLRGRSGVQLDWTEYDQEMSPFLDGTVFTQEHPLPGARATSVDLRIGGYKEKSPAQTLYLQEWGRHFIKKGWIERLYFYLWDEPSKQDFSKISSRGTLVHRAFPGLTNLVTTSYSAQLADVVDIWTPLINCFERKPGFEDFCTSMVSRQEYLEELKRGKKLWWYQSCASHGCGPSTDEYFRGWPSYAIDAPAISSRIMEWLTWKYKISGELYYSMTESYEQKRDPWQDFYLHGGNGDGSLFYPGRISRIGGKHDIPIESIRLKLIRDGLEDYEYLKLLSDQGFQRYADDQADRLVSSTYRWEQNPEVLSSVRLEMGRKLDSLGRVQTKVFPSARSMLGAGTQKSETQR